MSTTPETPILPPYPVALSDAQLEQLAGLVAARILDQLPESGERRTGLSSAEAAAYLGLSVETVRDEVAARRIASYQSSPGAPHRFDVDDLDAYRLRHRLEAVN